MRKAKPKAPGAALDTDRPSFDVAAGSVFSTAVRVRVAPGVLHGGRAIEFTARSVDDAALEARSKSRFIAP